MFSNALMESSIDEGYHEGFFGLNSLILKKNQRQTPENNKIHGLPWIFHEQEIVPSFDIEVPFMEEIICSLKKRSPSNIVRVSKASMSNAGIISVERSTRGQDSNHLWHQQRRWRITASNFGPAIKVMEKGKQPHKALLEDLFDEDGRASFRAIQYGQNNEEKALKKYCEFRRIRYSSVKRPGFILERSGIIGCSPDGVLRDRLIEIKCPYTLRDPNKHHPGYLTFDDDGYAHLDTETDQGFRYFHQVQGQMYICGFKKCDLFIWSPFRCYLVRIRYDPEWHITYKSILIAFFRIHMVPLIKELLCDK